MLRIQILLFFLIHIGNSSFAQAPRAVTGQTVVDDYNRFLKRTKVLNTFYAAGLTSTSGNTLPSVPSLANRKLKILTLRSASKFYTVTDFSKSVAKLVGRDSTDLFFASLFTKLYDYYPTSPNDLCIVISFRNSSLYNVVIYFDNGIKVVSNIPGAKGSTSDEGTGNPEISAYGGVVNSVTMDATLVQRLKSGLQIYISKLKTMGPPKISFPPMGNQNMVRIEVLHLRDNVTPGYHEQLFINLFLLPSKKGEVDVTFLFTLKYAPGVVASMRQENYKDASSNYYQQVSAFGQKLKEQIRLICKR